MQMSVEINLSGEHTVNLDEQALLAKAARYQVSSTQDKIRKTTSPGNAPLTRAIKGSGLPLRDTGSLLSSITYKVEGDRAIVGTNRQGARLNQEGGVIIPKKGQWLWIPASRSIRSQLRSYGGSITRLIQSYKSNGSYIYKKGGAFFARAKGKGGRETMLFILKKQVTIPARPFLYFSTEDVAIIEKMLGGTIEKSS